MSDAITQQASPTIRASDGVVARNSCRIAATLPSRIAWLSVRSAPRGVAGSSGAVVGRVCCAAASGATKARTARTVRRTNSI